MLRKHWKLLVAVVLLVAATAWAQNQVQPNQPFGNIAPVAGTDGTLARILATDSTGHLLLGASASAIGTVTLNAAIPAGANSIGTVGITNTPGSTDPCLNPSVLKSSTFKNITTATTTAVITSSGVTVIYICGFSYNMVATVAADTLLLEDGTGAACATTQVPKTATFSSGILANGSASQAIGFGGPTVFSTATSGEICAVSTVGTGPAIALQITYVQQ